MLFSPVVKYVQANLSTRCSAHIYACVYTYICITFIVITILKGKRNAG